MLIEPAGEREVLPQHFNHIPFQDGVQREGFRS
jgi:hypothetical protein